MDSGQVGTQSARVGPKSGALKFSHFSQQKVVAPHSSAVGCQSEWHVNIIRRTFRGSLKDTGKATRCASFQRQAGTLCCHSTPGPVPVGIAATYGYLHSAKVGTPTSTLPNPTFAPTPGQDEYSYMCMTLATGEGRGLNKTTCKYHQAVFAAASAGLLGRSWLVARGTTARQGPLKNVLDDLTLFQEQKYGFLAFCKCMIMAKRKQNGTEEHDRRGRTKQDANKDNMWLNSAEKVVGLGIFSKRP